MTAGPYTIYVTDINGCTSVNANVTLTQPSVISFTTSLTNVACHGGTSGIISVSATGGTSPYAYSSNGGSSYQTSSSLSGLSANSYSVVVKDANGCTVSNVITLTQPATLIVGNQNQQNVLCHGGATGQLILSHNGGVASYTYSDNGGSSYQSSNSFSSLTAGTYHVVLLDGNGCTATLTAVITQTSAINVGTTVTNVSCNGTNSGKILVTPSGGTPGYTYSDNGGSNYQPQQVFNLLDTGTYVVVVQDNNGCTASVTVTITEPPALTFTTTQTNVGCSGAGSITVSATGGIPGYMYSDDNGNSYQSSNVFTGLSVGTYQIIVIDNANPNPCQSSEVDVAISNITAITFTSTHINVTCNGGNNGSITVSASGGNSPYTYSDNNGSSYQSSNSFSGLTSGNYTLIVHDASNCTSSPASVTISQPSVITYSVSHTNDSCNGSSNGTITVSNVSGGTTPYTYSDGGNYQGSGSFTGLGPNSYSITVKDVNGCISSSTNVTITQPAIVTFTATSNSPSCNGYSNGSISVSASGGTSPYTYSHDGGATYGSMNGLPAGTYSLVAKDHNGCTSAPADLTITEPPVILISNNATNGTACSGGSDIVTASGGTPGYLYSDGSGYQLSDTFPGLTTGNYTVTVQDNNGCTNTATFSITNPSALSATASTTSASCNGGSDGSISASVSGGTSPFTYSNNGGSPQSSNTFGSLTAGTYTILVTDANNCNATASGIVTQPSIVTFTTTQTNDSCNNVADGTITVTASGGTSPYTYSDGSYQSSNVFTGLGPNTYTITVQDHNGCFSSSSNVTVTQPNAITYTATPTDASCNGSSTGSIAITGVSGGTGSYTYSDGGNYQSTNTFASLSASNYTITVKDANGCISTSTNVTVSQPTAITMTNNQGSNGCSGGIDTVVASGGTPGYNYSNGGNFQSSNIFTGMTVGVYTITVRDLNGCTATSSITVISSNPISMTNSVGNILCNGASTGSDTVSVTGGAGSYNYSINGGTPQSSNTFSGLTAGTYSIFVSDINGCTGTSTITLTQNSAINVSNFQGNVACYGGNNGRDTVVASGGTPGYTYSNGGVNFVSSNVFTGLTAGTYTMVAKDQNGCTGAASITITQNAALAPTITNSPSANVCSGSFGDPSDTMTISPAFTTYLWSTGATTQRLVVAPTNTNTYTVTVSNGGGCTASVSQTVTKTCPTPTGESVCCIGANHSATVRWNAVSCAYSYTIEFRQQYSPDTAVWRTRNVFGYLTDSTIFTGNNVLKAYTTYEWAVRSNCNSSSSIVSSFSSVNTFTTSGPRAAVVYNEFTVYPNPASEAVTVRFSSETENSPYIIRMYDMVGRMVMINNGETTEGDNQVELNIGSIAKGIYIVSLEENGLVNKLKLVVQ